MARCRRGVHALTWLSTALVLVTAMAGCRQPPQPEPPPTALAVYDRLTSGVEARGRVKAPVRYDLTSPVSGSVSRVLAAVGVDVVPGQTVLELACPDLWLAVARLEREVDLAQARLQELERKADVEPIRLARDRLLLELAKLEELSRQLVLRAPRGGLLAEWTLLKAGRQVLPGEEVGTILDDANLHAVLMVREEDIPIVEPGLVMLVYVEALGRELLGRVVDVDRDGVPQGTRRAYPVTVLLYNPGPVMGGMTVRGSLYHPEHREAMVAWGQIAPLERAPVVSASGGVVDEVYVRKGEWVTAGQPLARLVNAELELTMVELRYRLERTTAELAALESGRPSATTGELRDARAQLADRTEALEAARAALAALGVRSPLAGRVVSVPVAPGAPVDRGQVLATVVDYSRLVLKVLIHEEDVGRVRPGDPATVRLAAWPDRAYAAVVTAVWPEAVLQDGEAFFEATLEPLPEGAMAGMGVWATIAGRPRPEQVLIPLEALREQAGRHYVWVLDDQDRIVLRQVRAGRNDGVRVEILEGLEEGERVLLGPEGSGDR